jgi:hypothetical protein
MSLVARIWLLCLAGSLLAEADEAPAKSGLISSRAALRAASTGKAGAAKASAPKPVERFNLQFTEAGPFATQESVMERVFSTGEVARFMGSVSPETTGKQLLQQASKLMRPFHVAQERFLVVMPGSFSTNNASEWGLLVWCSPGAVPALPANWYPLLEKHKLLLVSPLNNGNQRNVQAQHAGSPFPFCYYENLAGALVARHNVVKRYGLNEGRVFVSGHSGGANSASILGVCFPDQFTGAIPFMACRSYVALPGSGMAGGPHYEKYLDPNYDRPPEGILGVARENARFVIVAGAMDTKAFGGAWSGSNRQEAEMIYQHQFQKEGYKHARFILAPGGHGLPYASVLEEALRFVTDAP